MSLFDKFLKKNLRVVIVSNKQPFPSMLYDLNVESQLICFVSQQAPQAGNNITFKITTSKGENVDGTGKIIAVKVDNVFPEHMRIELKYSQLPPEDIRRLEAEFMDVQTNMNEFFDRINAA